MTPAEIIEELKAELKYMSEQCGQMDDGGDDWVDGNSEAIDHIIKFIEKKEHS